MPSCSALFCPNQQEAGTGRSFHRFPFSRPAILKQWVKNMKRGRDWKPTIRSVVCSDHFEECNLERIGQAVYVKKEAVPTVFSPPVKKQKFTKTLRETSKKNSSPSSSSSLKDDDTDTRRLSLKRSLNPEIGATDEMPKKIYADLPEFRQQKKPFSSLTDIVNDLRNENLLSEGSAEILERSFSGVSLEMLLLKSKKANKLTRETYPPILRAFALTLQFYSSKAYEHVYNTFDMALPHPDVISRWYSRYHGEPGFTDEAFAAIKVRVSEAEVIGKEIVCSLTMDEISLQKQLEWDGSKLCGLVDLGTDNNDDTLPIATDALVFMIAALNDSWKLPCGYFIIDDLSGEEKANLVKICLEKLYDAQVKVVSLTCGGPGCSFSTIENLGGNLYRSKPLTPWFHHPSDNTQKVHVIFDACRMLRLVSNCFISSPFLLDMDGQLIKYSYVKLLHELFKNEGFHSMKQLCGAYISWKKCKTKGYSTIEAFNSSVADALEFCCEDLKLSEFQGCESTVRFIRTINHLCDILSSINPFAKNFKAPLSPLNEDVWRPFLKETSTYLMDLKDYRGVSIYITKKKTGFIGFLVNIQSAMALYNSLVAPAKPTLQQLTMNKMSQDYSELLFSAVCARSGWNHQPTCQQFISAYKCFVMQQEIQLQDQTKSDTNNAFTNPNFDLALLRRCDVELTLSEHKQDFSEVPFATVLPLYVEECVAYIGRYVVVMVQKLLHCTQCITSLHAEFPCEQSRLTVRKDRSDIVKPSTSVVRICIEVERCLKRVLNITEPRIPKIKEILPAISVAVLLKITQYHDIFSVLDEHMFDMSFDANHVVLLIKLITEFYVQLRLHNLTKEHP